MMPVTSSATVPTTISESAVETLIQLADATALSELHRYCWFQSITSQQAHIPALSRICAAEAWHSGQGHILRKCSNE